jgi:hypothetical protein
MMVPAVALWPIPNAKGFDFCAFIGYSWGMNPVNSESARAKHFVRHKKFSPDDLHGKSLYWKSNTPSPRYEMKVQERRKDGRYILLAVQNFFPSIPPDLSEHGPNSSIKRIHPQIFRDSLDQAIVDKIVRVETTRVIPWRGYAFAVRSRLKSASVKRRRHIENPPGTERNFVIESGKGVRADQWHNSLEARISELQLRCSHKGRAISADVQSTTRS